MMLFSSSPRGKVPTNQLFKTIEGASDEDLMAICSGVLWFPFDDTLAKVVMEVVTAYEETGILAASDRKRVVDALLIAISPGTN